jgi:hypothetical protein
MKAETYDLPVEAGPLVSMTEGVYINMAVNGNRVRVAKNDLGIIIGGIGSHYWVSLDNGWVSLDNGTIIMAHRKYCEKI